MMVQGREGSPDGDDRFLVEGTVEGKTLCPALATVLRFSKNRLE